MLHSPREQLSNVVKTIVCSHGAGHLTFTVHDTQGLLAARLSQQKQRRVAEA